MQKSYYQGTMTIREENHSFSMYRRSITFNKTYHLGQDYSHIAIERGRQTTGTERYQLQTPFLPARDTYTKTTGCNRKEEYVQGSLNRVPVDFGYSLRRYLSDRAQEVAPYRCSPRQDSLMDLDPPSVEQPQNRKNKKKQSNQDDLFAHIGAWTEEDK